MNKVEIEGLLPGTEKVSVGAWREESLTNICIRQIGPKGKRFEVWFRPGELNSKLLQECNAKILELEKE